MTQDSRARVRRVPYGQVGSGPRVYELPRGLFVVIRGRAEKDALTSAPGLVPERLALEATGVKPIGPPPARAALIPGGGTEEGEPAVLVSFCTETPGMARPPYNSGVGFCT